jgi:hypothetical protein
MMTNEIIAALKAVLAVHCPTVFFGISRPKYPKIDADLREVSIESGFIKKYLLTLDYWNDTGSFTELNDLADEAGVALDYLGGFVKCKGYLTIRRSGNRFPVYEKDNDKIAHITERFEINFYERGSE